MVQWKLLNVITLSLIKSDNINRKITITEEFCLLFFCKWDLEMWLHQAADNIIQ